MKSLFIAGLFAASLSGAVVLDRIAVIAGDHVIKASDIERDLRVTAFINNQRLDLSPAARRAAAERLADQQIIRQELAVQGYPPATDEDANALQEEILKNRFGGSAAQLRSTLQRYGLTQQDFHEQLLWQLTVLRFIDARFRPGVLVSDEDIAAYYKEHLAEIRKESPADYTLEAVAPRIRTALEGERIDREFESWLTESRRRVRIQYREAAFQ